MMSLSPMSQLGPLLRKLKESGAERVFFAPNEHGIALDGEARRAVSGGPIAAATILEAVSELLSNDDILGLSQTRPRIVRHEHDGEEFVLEIVRQQTGVALGIRQAQNRAAGKPTPRAAPVAAPASPVGTMKAKPFDPEMAIQARRAESPIELDLSPRDGLAHYDTKPVLRRVDDPRAAPAFDQVAFLETARQAAREAASEIARQIAREVAEETALQVARQTARDIAHETAREIAQETASEIADTATREATRAGSREARKVREPAAVAAPRTGPARIDTLLREMLQKKASDLHLTAASAPVFRIDGEIHFANERGVLASNDILEMVHEIMTPRGRNDYEARNDADFAYEIPGLARFRVNVFRDRHGTGAVLRQIPIEIMTAEKLGLPKACLDLCWLSKGLVLVTGPTGSGKSTTLAAMVDFINKNRSDHIITIEDPVEFVHQNQRCLVNQREVGQHTESFRAALRAALREDPDIVLVGEMRDLETISIAIETAETGHLVFGTLHTTTAISTIDRIIDQFPTDRQEQIRVMLSESLKGVVAQILCPKIGGGRVAAHEILLGTTAVGAMIREGKTFQLTSTMQTSKGQGMVTMNDSLMALVQKKLVDPKQAYIKAVDKAGFVNMLKNAGIAAPI